MLRVCFLGLIAVIAVGQAPRTNVQSGKRYPRIVIRGAMVVDGSGTPASGPKDIVIENNMIADVFTGGGGRRGGRYQYRCHGQVRAARAD